MTVSGMFTQGHMDDPQDVTVVVKTDQTVRAILTRQDLRAVVVVRTELRASLAREE